MKNNKRGQFFALYLVFITLTMMGVVIGLFVVQQNGLQGAIVSPMDVLSERDALEIFEGKEIVLIRNSLESSEGEFGSELFHDSFRENFINEIMNNEKMREFLFSNVSIRGVKIPKENKNENLIRNGIYPKGISSINESEFIFARTAISKNYLMIAEESDNKVNFPVRFDFEFEAEYLIKSIDDKFIVRRL